MVIYFHTRRHIFVVANGFCSAVVDTCGEKVFCNLVGSKLLAGVTSDLRDELAPESITAGMLLKFAVGPSNIMTDQILMVEIVESLSIPPSHHFGPPESGKEGQPRVTLPEIIVMPRPDKVPG